MKITTTARHYDLTPALKEYAESKVEHLTTFFENLSSAHIVFALEKYRHFVEVTIHSNGHDFVAHDTSDDMYASVDAVAEKLERQVLKHKGKLFDKKKAPKLGELPVDLGPEEGEDSEEDREGEIFAADPLEFPRLTRGEAVAKLRANGKEFSIFSDRTTNRVVVLFKREDGTIGLIESK